MTESKDSGLSLKDRLRSFLNIHKNQTVPVPSGDEGIEDLNAIDIYLNEITTAHTLDSRLDTLQAMETLLTTKQLERGVIEKVWISTKDLLEPNLPPTVRSRYFDFLQHLISYQYRNFQRLVTPLYQKLTSMDYKLPNDILQMFLIIDALSDHGKHLKLLDENISPYLVFWMDVVGHNTVYLSFLLNVIKFNSSNLDEMTIEGVVHHLCIHCMSTSSSNLGSLLKVLDAIICYNSFPQSCLHDVIITLCKTLNQKNWCDDSWKIMRNLLGTHLGHSCVQTMCKILQNVQTAQDALVLRSAVFYLGMGLWGSKCVTNLMHKPQSILPYFEHALQMQNPVIGYEVSLTCHRLVKKFGHELHPLAWESILKIVDVILTIASSQSRNEQLKALQKNTHELVTLIENLYSIQAFDGTAEDLFTVTEKHCRERPTESVVLLLTYKAQSINPAKDGWISNLTKLMQKFFSLESKTNVDVRLKALEIMSTVALQNFEMYEKDFIDLLTTLGFQNIHAEPTVHIQEKAVTLLMDLALLSKTIQCGTLLQCLKPLVYLAIVPPSFVSELKQGNNPCISMAVKKLVCFFQDKFYSGQASRCADVYEMIVGFLTSYYKSQLYHATYLSEARIEALDLLFNLQANFKHQMKLVKSEHFSSLISCVESESETQCAYPTVVLPVKQAISCFVQCLEKEKHWGVLSSALSSLCEYLENKCLILSADRALIRTLAEVIGNLVSGTNRDATLIGTPADFRREDLQSAALRVLTVMASYHEQVDISRQRQMIRCLETGFATKCAKQCISATTLCMVEMNSDAFLRVLPSILLHLSQMSATVHLATVVLELLSTLSQLPSLYRNFVEDQYMSVFAIALEHATPDKFSLYVVSMAHYVIGMWFVKCRLSFRPDFVQFITRKLQNVNRNSMKDSLQHGLIESCIDVMARYTFSNSMSAASCKKDDRKIKGGNSATWLLGNRLVTITTQGRTPSHARPTSNIEVSDSKANNDFFSQSTIERRQSVEAPGKLQSTNRSSMKTLRTRHKSGGGVLATRQGLPADQLAASSVAASNLESSVCLTEKDVSTAEICIRRPSGNTSFVLCSQQISLVQITTEVPNEIPRAKKITRFEDDLLGTANSNSGRSSPVLNGDHHECRTPRARSHTVSTAQDYTQGAAARAAARVKQQRMKANTGDLFQDSIGGQPQLKSLATKSSGSAESTLTPGFVFLQLFQSAKASGPNDCPLLLPSTATIERAVQVLDMIPPYDTWATGVVYVRHGQQTDPRSILSNEHGSPRYQDFLSSLGQLVALSEADSSRTYLGGLDQSEGEDGLFTYVWQENVMQMVFHVTTLMPNHGTDISCKQRHIGNDYVTIVYDDNPKGHYVPGCVVKGQFLSVEIVITPLELGFNCVQLEYHKPEVRDLLQVTEKRIVSDRRLALLVKQMALHANMAAAAHRYHNKAGESVSKPFARLKQIKRIRVRVQQENAKGDEAASDARKTANEKTLYGLEEFSEYV